MQYSIASELVVIDSPRCGTPFGVHGAGVGGGGGGEGEAFLQIPPCEFPTHDSLSEQHAVVSDPPHGCPDCTHCGAGMGWMVKSSPPVGDGVLMGCVLTCAEQTTARVAAAAKARFARNFMVDDVVLRVAFYV